MTDDKIPKPPKPPAPTLAYVLLLMAATLWGIDMVADTRVYLTTVNILSLTGIAVQIAYWIDR
jgi:hypothetical protein